MIRPAFRLQQSHSRRGAVLVITMVVLLLLSLMSAALLRLVLAQRGRVRQEQFSRQVDLLVSAGRGRALARLKADPAWQGETWKIAAAELGGSHTAEIIIAVKKSEQTNPGSAAIALEVKAAYPSDVKLPIQRTRTYGVGAP